MRALIVTMSSPVNNSIMWTFRDQNYLPRLRNYLKVEYPQYEWEERPFYTLTEELLANYEAIVLPRTVETKRCEIEKMAPTVKIITIPVEEFMYQLASRGGEVFKSSGYVLTQGPKLRQKGSPLEKKQFSNEHLHQLMRDYPFIQWEVLSFEEIKLRLAEAGDQTVALTPSAASYRKFLEVEFPAAQVIDILPNTLRRPARGDDQLMMGIVLLTVSLMLLLIFSN